MSIKIEELSFVYMKGTPFEKKALNNINLEIEDGQFVAIIGHTGSGKSTLIQHINGLLKPSDGKLYVDNVNILEKGVLLSDIRKKVGLVFQYPEYQLFEETVEKDISFGPKNLGLDDTEIKIRVRKAMDVVGLDYDEYSKKSPFELSGGQKRRVAIAGVIAMEPRILILDEPTAGLDPKGRDDILDQIKKLQSEYLMTIILVSHSMEDVSKIAERIIVMDEGKIILDGSPSNIFRQVDMLEKVGLAAPQITYLVRALNKKGIILDEDTFTIDSAKKQIVKLMEGRVND